MEGVQQARAIGTYCVRITDTFISPIAPLLTNVSDASGRVPQQFLYGANEFAECLTHHLRPSAPSPNRAHLKKADREQRNGIRGYSDAPVK